MHFRAIFYLPVVLLIVFALSFTNADNTIYGHWKLVREKSTDLVTWRYRQLELEIRNHQGAVTILQNWVRRKKIGHVDSVTFTPGKGESYIVQQTPTWSGNWYMGVLSQKGSRKKMYGEWKEQHRVLQVETEEVLQTSQGEAIVKTVREYSLENNGETLVVREKRSTRPTPIVLVFEKHLKE